MTLTRSGSEIAEYFALEMAEQGVAESDGSPLRSRFNIAPSQAVAVVVAQREGLREMAWKQWGLVPSWTTDAAMGGRLFNARSETAHEKPSFRGAWKRRRCLVIADGFYEWTTRDRGHRPHHFYATDGSLLGLAGLYEHWLGEGGEVIESCTVLTTQANVDLEGVHHRMPVILGRARFDAWLDPASDPALLKALMVPALPGTLNRLAVSRRVNSPRFDDPECLVADSEPKALCAPHAGQGELFDVGEGGAE